jgi:hypothetical protein
MLSIPLVAVRRAAAAVVLIAVLVATGACAGAVQPARRDTSLRVAIIIDRSGTYRLKLQAAIAKTIALLERLAATKVHRWEQGNDRISIIALDAMPDVIWQGSLADLKQIDRRTWTTRLAAREDYAGCTDLGAAFQLAVREVQSDASNVARYVFAFTDFIHEPPVQSLRACAAAASPSLPPATFPWDALAQTSVTAFWVPPNQVLAWRRVIEERELAATFVLHSASESDTVTIPAPPRPKVTIDETERAANRDRLAGFGQAAVRGMGYVAVGFGLLLTAVFGLGLWLRFRRGGHPRPAHRVRRPGSSASHGRNVPPLRLATLPLQHGGLRPSGDVAPGSRRPS